MADWKRVQDWKRRHVNEMSRVAWGHHKHAENFTEATLRTVSEICIWATMRGLIWATEVQMTNGLRADVAIPELETSVVEVYDSEPQNSLARKKSQYQQEGIEMLAVPADPHKAISLLEYANGLDQQTL